MTIDYHSLSEAFKTVKANHGCAGVDGVTIERFESDLSGNLRQLEKEISSGTYFPLPLMKILVDKGKGDGEARALCIPTVRDRVVQTAVLQFAGPVLEKEFEDCSFAYRKGRSVRQAVHKIREYYGKGYRWVVDADIDAFFDNVDHAILIEKLRRCVHDQVVLRLMEQWLSAEVWDGVALKALERGIPQGSPVSPLMANLFLDELDEEMLRHGYKYVRYADDFIVLARTREKARSALELSKKVLDRLMLKLDEEKIVTFENGFKYLGVYFIRSLVMTPFDRPKKKKKVLYYPPPLDMNVYMLQKHLTTKHTKSTKNEI